MGTNRQTHPAKLSISRPPGPLPLAGEARAKRAERVGTNRQGARPLEKRLLLRYEPWMPVDRDPWLVVRAQQLRMNQTNAESILWQKLRARRLAGHRFRRQHPIGPYIVDFACLAAWLVVEVDGPTHEDAACDLKRDRDLAERNFQTIRVWNNDVYENLDGVLEIILNKLPPPSS